VFFMSVVARSFLGRVAAEGCFRKAGLARVVTSER
jgi:hypothetical protein